MTQYNILQVKLSNLQFNKLKLGIKNGTEVILKVSSNVVGDSNDENNFPHVSLTNTQVSKLCKAFANGWSANTKLSRSQLHKIGQPGGFLSRLLGPLLKTGLQLIRNLLRPLAKSILITSGLTAAAAATDATIHKKMFGSGVKTFLILNKEMNDIMKMVKSLEKSGLLIKWVSKTIKNKAKEQKGGFLGMLLGTLGASLLGNVLTGKGTIAWNQGQGTIRAGECTFSAGEGTVRTGQDF